LFQVGGRVDPGLIASVIASPDLRHAPRTLLEFDRLHSQPLDAITLDATLTGNGITQRRRFREKVQTDCRLHEQGIQQCRGSRDLPLRTLTYVANDSGLETTAYRTDLQNRMASPFACFLLPFLALCYCSIGPPFPRPATACLICIAIAVGHALVSGVATSMGHSGMLSPVVAGWGPPILFGAWAAVMGSRLRLDLLR
jgi:lipopolysaccharide export system permease protein